MLSFTRCIFNREVWRRQARTLFIKTETTPNDNSLMFKPGKSVTDGQVVEFLTPNQARRHSDLADDLFRIEGVRGVLFGKDFITVNKSQDSSWTYLKPSVFAAITEYFSMNKPLLKSSPDQIKVETMGSGVEYSPEDVEVVMMIKEILDTRIRPVVQGDGGDVKFVSYMDGIVELLLRGACRSCSSSVVTLKHGIENMLMHYVPEVKEVRQVDDPLEAESENYFKKIESEHHGKPDE